MSKPAEILNDQMIKGLSAPDDKAVYYTVTGAPNLYLQHQKSGGKHFVYQCRYAGKALRLKMGAYPGLSLARARALAAAAKAAAKEGKHPGEAFEQTGAALPYKRTAGAVPTLAQIVEEYVSEARIGRKTTAGTREDNARRLRRHILQDFGAYPITQCTPEMLCRMLAPVGESSPPTLEKLIGNLKSVFEYAQVRHGALIERNPAAWEGVFKVRLEGLLSGHEEQNFFALPVDAAPAFYAQLKAEAENNRIARGVAPYALMFLMLTCSRTGEVVGRVRRDLAGNKVIANRPLTWAEIDLDAKVWTIQPDRTKNGRGYDIPLSDEAIRVLKETRKRVKPRSLDAQVFPSHMAAPGDLPSNNFLSAVVERVGLTYPHTIKRLYQATAPAQEKLPTVHGMRSTCVDFLKEIGIPDSMRSLVLNHIRTDDTERDGALSNYTHTTLFEQRAVLMEVYARYLTTGAKPPTWFDVVRPK